MGGESIYGAKFPDENFKLYVVLFMVSFIPTGVAHVRVLRW